MMKKFDVRKTMAHTMSGMLYGVLFIMVCGFIVKILSHQTSGLIPADTSIADIFRGVVSLKSDDIFALGAYMTLFSPFIFAMIIFIGYFLRKQYKAALLGLTLAIVLALSLIVKSA